MTIEIVDFPIKHGGSFHSYVSHSGCLVTSLVTLSRWELWTNFGLSHV